MNKQLKIQLDMIDLFNKVTINNEINNDLDFQALKLMVEHGIVLNLDFLKSIQTNKQLEFVTKLTEKYGASNVAIQSSFYKLMSSVENASEFELLLNQLIHYSALNENGSLKSTDLYEPEKVENQELFKNANDDYSTIFKHIEVITHEEAQELIKNMICSSAPLDSEDVSELKFLLIEFFNIDEIVNLNIHNKELMCQLFDYINENLSYQKYQFVPKDPIEFLRYVVYSLTNSTLLIKNKELYNSLLFSIENDDEKLYDLLSSYVYYHDIKNLASIFNRFKPIFMTLKTKNTKSIINKISRLSKKYHKGMVRDKLANAIDMLDKKELSLDELIKYINEKEPDAYQLVKLYNASSLKLYRLYDSLRDSKYYDKSSKKFDVSKLTHDDNIVIDQYVSNLYKVRNGKTFIKSENNQLRFNRTDHTLYNYIDIYLKLQDYLEKLLIEKTNKNLKNYVIRLDELNDFVSYKVPTSSKNFIGHVPEFSVVKLDANLNTSLGVTWQEEMDLDLSLHDINSQEYLAWNNQKRSNDDTILFSGDMVGLGGNNYANESMYIDHTNKDNLSFGMTTYNSYNFESSGCKYKLSISDNVNKNNYANIKNIKINLPLTSSYDSSYIAHSFIHEHENKNERWFVINETKTGFSVVNKPDLSKASLDAVKSKSYANLKLNELIEKSDVLVARNEDEYKDFINWCKDLKTIDLRPDYVSKNDILKFIQ